MDAKLLTESGLKALLSKHKIKDNGLQKALAAYDKLEDDAHDDCLEQLAQIGKLATALKKAKEAAANKAVVDYLENLLDARDHEEKDVNKDKEAAAKTDAAKAKAKKDEEDEDEDDKDKDEDEDGDDEEEEGAYGDRLLTAFKKCKSMNGESLDFIICDARPFPAVMLARRISSKHRKELTEMADGSKKFHRGTCRFEDGKYVLTTEQQMPGLVRRVQLSVKNHTGKKFKFVHGDETAGDEEGDAPDAAQAETEPSGRDAGSPQGDASQGDASSQGSASPQAASSPPATAGAQAAPPPIEPPQPIAPPTLGKPELAKAPAVWHSTRDILDKNLDALKKAVLKASADEHPDLVKQINQNMGKLDAILGTLDTKLAVSLGKAHAARDDAARKAELKNSKAILVDYIKYVKSEPLIAHVDSNPFGVATNLKKIVVDSLTHMAQSIGS